MHTCDPTTHLAREVQRRVAILVRRGGGRPSVEEAGDAPTVPPSDSPDQRSVAVVVDRLERKKDKEKIRKGGENTVSWWAGRDERRKDTNGRQRGTWPTRGKKRGGGGKGDIVREDAFGGGRHTETDKASVFCQGTQ